MGISSDSPFSSVCRALSPQDTEEEKQEHGRACQGPGLSLAVVSVQTLQSPGAEGSRTTLWEKRMLAPSRLCGPFWHLDRPLPPRVLRFPLSGLYLDREATDLFDCDLLSLTLPHISVFLFLCDVLYLFVPLLPICFFF